ncbi:MAG: LutB/LldF family L-lactate oxidation iron-sulfur protein, partial [Sediminibacterium sp.]|nr:LutB/LldF family L-lactate oxidation iron-sulfur protein [Sediminibacterium sp.]
MNKEQIFTSKSTIISFDLKHRKTINFNIGKYNDAVKIGKKQYCNLDEVRNIAHQLKKQAIENLDNYLIEFEEKVIRNGGNVIWANDSDDALNAILAIAKKNNCTSVVKSKSMVTEEIHLNKFLEKNNIESIETDLGEYIQQLDNEPPYHIVTPAMHKSKEDVAALFHKHLHTPLNYTPEQLTLEARKQLRKKYVEAQIGITGANFILPDIGGIAITENEGNARLSMALPKIHIAIVGIEKVIPSYQDLALFWSLLATHGTGQQITVYNSIITGPKQINETDGPAEFHVILLDNGRSNLLADKELRKSLYCIRCGACLNACPVYKNIGGHSYNTTYSGPIGAVISPHLNNFHELKHISNASSLCGNCTEVCPVKIPIHELILQNRFYAVEQNEVSFSEKMAWKIWKMTVLNRKRMNMG